VASLLIPFPYAVDDHQTHNAHFLSMRGAAVLMPQTELSAGKLALWLGGMDREQLNTMAQHARAVAKADAAEAVAKVCKELTE